MDPRRPGRPRKGDAEAVRHVIQELMREGVESFTVPELIAKLTSRLGVSRRTSYRLLHRACEEGAVHIPGF